MGRKIEGVSELCKLRKVWGICGFDKPLTPILHLSRLTHYFQCLGI